MFHNHSARQTVSVDYRMMLHAYVASWGSADPYCQSGAALAIKDILRGTACSHLIGDTYQNNKIYWDDPSVYSYVVPAEIKLLEFFPCDKSPMFDAIVYITTIPHPDSVRVLLDRGVKKIFYGPQKHIAIPNDYKDVFRKMSLLYHNVVVEPYLDKLHWVKDKLDLIEQQVPELFG